MRQDLLDCKWIESKADILLWRSEGTTPKGWGNLASGREPVCALGQRPVGLAAEGG